jgi:hypothetical protein
VTPIPDLGRYLCGRWQIARDLVDRARNVVGTFSGIATVIAQDATTLHYVEEGTVDFDGYRGEAVRRYSYDLRDDGSAMVRFADGRDFHVLDLRAGVARARHDCGDDVYLGRIRARSIDRLETRWRVTGPGRDLVLVTQFQRLD